MADKTTNIAAKITVDSTDAQKNLGETKKQIDSLGNSAEKSTKSAKETAGAFGSIGNALKSLGIIGAITAAFNFFRETLSKNQKVADSVAAVFNTISTVINTLIDIFISVTTEVGKNTNGFAALGKVLGGVLTLVITPLKAAFDGVKLVINEIQLAWEKSPLGDKDQTTIKELTKSINETKESLSQTGKNAVQAGKDIYNNFGEAASSVVDVVSGVVEKASKINVAAIYEQSKATIALQNNAKIAAAQLQGLVEQYDRQAEQLRQVRDDEFKSIDERIAANDALGKVLDNQEKALKRLANQRVAAAAAELAQNKSSVELQAALIEAQNEVAAVEAQVAGLRSEQLVNATALTKEKIALDQANAASENKLLLDRKKAIAALIKDEEEKLNQQKAIAQEEADIELKRLQDNINNTQLGTQARVDAEIAFKEKKQEIELSLLAFDDQIKKAQATAAEKKRQDDLLAIQNQLSDENATFEQQRALIQQREALLLSDKELTEAQRVAIQKQSSDAINQIDEKEKEARIKRMQDVGNIAQNLGAILGQQTAAGKALGIATAAINTYQGATEALKEKSTLPQPFSSIQRFVSAAAIIAAGIKSIKAITSVQVPGGGGGGSMPSGLSMPSMNVSAPLQSQPVTTTLNQAQVNQIGNVAARAYVVESDVSNAQERADRLNRAATIM